MKLLGRIALILLAALAVSGVTYELGQIGMLSAIAGAGHAEGRPPGLAGAPNQSSGGNVAASGQRQPPAGFQGGGRDEGERDEGGFSLFGFTELGKAFLTTAVVVVAAAPIVSLIQRRRRTRRKELARGPNASA